MKTSHEGEGGGREEDREGEGQGEEMETSLKYLKKIKTKLH